MIQIPLVFEGSKAQLLLDPDPHALPWDPRKNYCWNYKYDKTNLSHPFKQVFLKRWIGGVAPAHQLLVKAQGKKIPGTPCIVGMGQAGIDWIYVFERLPKSYLDLNKLLKGKDAERYLTADILKGIVKQAEACFAGMEDYNYVYTDFTVKNIMVDPSKNELAFIDLDSSWSYPYLENQRGQFTNDFDTYFWYLWDTYLLPARRPLLPSPEKLPMAMVVSFAAVWGRAMGMLHSQQHPNMDAFLLIDSPSKDKQEQFWAAIKEGDEDAFYDYLLLPSRTDGFFQEWQEIFKELLSPREISWFEIPGPVNWLASLYPSQSRVIPPVPDDPQQSNQLTPSNGPPPSGPPVSPARQLIIGKHLWDVGEGLLHGLIDPFWILRKSGKLKRKSPYR
jgi:hypothetical protein